MADGLHRIGRHRAHHATQAIVFVDGRYVTQLADQVDGSVFTGGDLVNEPPHLSIPRNGKPGMRLGSIRGCIPAPRSAAWKKRLRRSVARW